MVKRYADISNTLYQLARWRTEKNLPRCQAKKNRQVADGKMLAWIDLFLISTVINTHP